MSSCQEVKINNYELEATALNEDGLPIEGIQVITGKLELQTEDPFPITKPVTTKPILTDETGVAIVRFKSVQEASGNITFYQDGYYTTRIRSNPWEMPDGFNAKSRKAKVQAIIKPMNNPIPMVMHPSTGLHLREIGKEYALDIELGEMLPPYGNGKVSDILVTLQGERVDRGPDQEEDIDFRVNIRFSNPHDGFVEFEGQPLDGATGSRLVSAHEAPEDGYFPSLERIALQGDIVRPEGFSNYRSSLERKAYYFRIRSRTDESGNLISAHYGKIYGPIQLNAGRKRKVFHPQLLEASLSMREVYFNPQANDRNVECDTSVNLSGKMDRYGKPILPSRP